MLGKGYLCAVVTQDAWQTPTTNMDMVRSEEGVQKRIAFRASIGRKSIPDGNLGEQMQRLHGQAAPANPSTDGNRQEFWRTPSSSDGEGGVMEMREGCAGKYKLRDHVVAEQKSWATPRAGKTTDENPETWAARQAKGDVATMPLTAQVKCWATPIMGDSHLASTPEVAQKRIEEGKVTLSRQNPGKLNPRWVETLMGLPVGWVMPSCASPVTIEPTNCDYSATESSQPQPSELFAF
jgi:hypothetical protein